MQLERTGLVSIIILAVIVSSVGGAYVYFNYFHTPEKIVEVGDCVLVNYIAKYANNRTVFATSYEDVAKENGIYNENASYKPLKIFVDPDGSREIPKGFENFSSFPPLGMKKGFIKYLVGMKEGESKTVVLSPDEAYGTWNETLAAIFRMDKAPRYQKLNCTRKINKTIFVRFFRNVSIEENVTFDYLADFGIEGVLNATIINVDNQNVTIKLLPVNGTVFQDPVTKANVTVIYDEGSDNFTLWYDFKVNQTFTQYNLFGQPIHCKILEVNRTTVKMAINIYAPSISLVAQPIEVFLHVEKIYKTSKTD